MQDAGRAVRARLGQFAEARPGLMARLRLFGLLILLLPLFAGLQYMVGAGGSRVEVRFVSQDVPIFVPVERIVERVVERVIYVPVQSEATPESQPPGATPTPPSGGTPTPAGIDPSGAGAPVASQSDQTADVAAPGGLTATGAAPVGPGPGLPVSPVGAAPLMPVMPLPPSVAVTDGLGTGSAAARPAPRAAGRRPVIIASEDRLGPGPTAKQPAAGAQQTSRQRRDDENGNGNDNRSVGRNSGGQPAPVAASSNALSVPPAAPAGAKQPEAGGGGSVEVVELSEPPTQPGATPTPHKTLRPKPIAEQRGNAGQTRQTLIPEPVGVKP
jgi:hypothetical protein